MQNDVLDLQMKFARKNPIRAIDMEDDAAFRAQVSHVLHGRTLMQFVAQVGLSREQAMNMTGEQIACFTADADEREAESDNGSRGYTSRAVLPSRFTLDD